MKTLRLIFSLLAMLCIIGQSSASHVSGGAITYKSIGNGKYYVEADVIRDCSGIQYTSWTASVTAQCLPSGSITAYTLAHLPFVAPATAPFSGPYSAITFNSSPNAFSVEEVSDVCNKVLDPTQTPSTRCRVSAGSTIQGFTRFRYSGILTLSACSNRRIYFTPQCCRNTGSSNVTSGAMYVETRFDNQNFPNNSAPDFYDARLPFRNACVNQISRFQVGANSTDKDSMTYILNCSKISPTACASYQTGFSYSSPINGFKFDSLTGSMMFKPSVVGKRVVTYVVNEYERCTGKWKSSTLREVQFRVQNCTNLSPRITHGIHNVQGQFAQKTDSFKINVREGYTFSFQDTIYDPDIGSDTIRMISDHHKVCPGSSLKMTYMTRNKMVFTFSWTPPSNFQSRVLHIEFTDDKCDYPNNTQVAYHIGIDPKLNILKNGVKMDTLLLMKGDTIELTAGLTGTTSWSSISGSPVNWSGAMRNIWGDTTSSDTNRAVKYRPLQSTFLSATGLIDKGCPGLKLSTDSVFIKVIPTFQLGTSGDTIVCQSSDSMYIEALPDTALGQTYIWNTSGGMLLSNNSQGVWVTKSRPGIYRVTATSAQGGVRTAELYVNVLRSPKQGTITSSTDSICAGGKVELTGGFVQSAASCGAAQLPFLPFTYQSYDSLNQFNGTNLNMRFPNPFAANDKHFRHQYLYRAADLKAKKMKAGVLKSVSFYIDSLSSTSIALKSYNVSLACIKDTSMNAMTLTGLTPVLLNKSFTLTTGWNKLEFDTGYYWDGTENLLVNVCYEVNSPGNHRIKVAQEAKPYLTHLSSFGNQNLCSSGLLSFANPLAIPVTRFELEPELDTADYQMEWFSGGVSLGSQKSNIQVRPKILTIYQLVISDSNKICSDTVSKTIYVNATHLDAGPDTSICAGERLLLNAQIQPALNGYYSWTPAGKMSTHTSQFTYFQSNTSDTVVANYIDSAGCSASDTVVISVNPLPDPSFSVPFRLCETESSNSLSAVVPGGTFSGTGVSGSNIDASDPALKPGLLSPKSTTVKYELTVNGCSNDSIQTVQIFPQFDTVYTGTRLFCVLDPVYPLQTRHTGGLWSGTGVSASSFNPNTAGIGTHLIYVDSTGFCGNSSTYKFEVLPKPSHDFPTTVYGCKKIPAILDAGNPGASYLWNTGDTVQSITATSNGLYWVKINVGNTCELIDSTNVLITDVCAGLYDLDNKKATLIYPNPSKGYVNILFGDNNATHIALTNFAGQLILHQTVENKSRIDIDVGTIPSGTYLLKIFRNNEPETHRLIITND